MKRGRSRSRSRSYSDDDDGVVDKVKLSEDDAAFILGKGGKTKEKIARVSGANIDLPSNSLTLHITGPRDARRRARLYVECVMDQRIGDVVLDDRIPHFYDDCTIVRVPSECAGFVTGTQGSFLRQVEQEYGTIMFFVHLKGDTNQRRDIEKLAIFGTRRGRRGAELKIMAAIESRLEGFLTDHIKDHLSDSEDFGTDIRVLRPQEVSWALGKKGTTRKKLAWTSGCLVEYVGNAVHMSGTGPERRRAGEYLKWVMQQLDGNIDVDTEGRNDVTVLKIPHDCVGYVTGTKRATLAKLEEDWSVFMMFLDRRSDRDRDGQRTAYLAIFGKRKSRRGAELKVMSTVDGKSPGYFSRNLRSGTDSHDWGTDVYEFRGEELSYALGHQGTTKRKLAKAADCLLEFVGDFALCSGDKEERRRGMRYLHWLLRQRTGTVQVDDIEPDRHPDVQQMHLPAHTIADVMGPKGSGLRAIEEDTGTFLFMAHARGDTDVLLICSAHAECRRRAEQAVHAVIRGLDRDRDGSRDRDRDHEDADWDRPRREDGGALVKYRKDDDDDDDRDNRRRDDYRRDSPRRDYRRDDRRGNSRDRYDGRREDDKKYDDKKYDDKKYDDKKYDDKKYDDKKYDDKKHDDKKYDDKKYDDKKYDDKHDDKKYDDKKYDDTKDPEKDTDMNTDDKKYDDVKTEDKKYDAVKTEDKKYDDKKSDDKKYDDKKYDDKKYDDKHDDKKYNDRRRDDDRRYDDRRHDDRRSRDRYTDRRSRDRHDSPHRSRR